MEPELCIQIWYHTLLHQALDLAQQLGDERRFFINHIRLAHVYQWQEQYDRSNQLFEMLFAQSADGSLHTTIIFYRELSS